MNLKNYIVEYETQHRDRETYTKYIISAPCSATAGHYGIYLMSYDPSNLEWEDDLESAADDGYNYYHKLYDVEEIIPADLETLKKHIPSYKYNKIELNKCGEYEELWFIINECKRTH